MVRFIKQMAANIFSRIRDMDIYTVTLLSIHLTSVFEQSVSVHTSLRWIIAAKADFPRDKSLRKKEERQWKIFACSGTVLARSPRAIPARVVTVPVSCLGYS